MKTISAVMMTGVFLALSGLRAFCQSAGPAAAIEPYRLAVSYAKTTHLIFPYSIKSVDRGSKDILVQKAKGVDNVLQVKAGRVNFKETNLTVITADGKLYSYLVNYTEKPAVLTIKYAAAGKVSEPEIIFSNTPANDAEIQKAAEKASAEKENVKGISDHEHRVTMRLNGLFIRNDIMYWKAGIENHSNISYDIGQIRFFIRDQKKVKRTAVQEIEIKPLYVLGDASGVAAQTEQILVFALPKFTIPDKKSFHIQVMELNGGRHLELKIRHSTIIKSKPLIF